MSQENKATDTGRRIDISEIPKQHAKAVRRDQFSHKREKVEVVPYKAPQKPKSKPAQVARAPKVEREVVQKKPEAALEPIKHIARPQTTVWDDSGDFAAMLDAQEPIKRLELSIGNKVSAKLIHTSKTSGFFSLGHRHEASMAIAELLDSDGNLTVQVGDTIDAYVASLEGGILLSKKLSAYKIDVDMLMDAQSSGMPVEGKVVGVNKGGLDITLSGTRAFCPVSQIDTQHVLDPSVYVGQTLTFMVTQVGEGGRNVVISRRVLLERARQEKAAERLKTLQEGSRAEGNVVRTVDAGAIVDLDGIEGFVPRSELGHGHVLSVSDVVNVGDRVIADVLRLEADPKRPGTMRVLLSLKSAQPDPFFARVPDLQIGTSAEGKVVRLEAFGAFVELFPGVDGLIHISELSDKKVKHPNEVLQVGDAVTVRILSVDPATRRIGLSLRENIERTSKKAAEPNRSTLKRGDKVEGTVERVERYGVFIRLTSGETGLLPRSESGSHGDMDLNKAFPIGTHIATLVIDVDDRGRIRLSNIAREQAEERDLVTEHGKRGGGDRGLGTLGDLLRAKQLIR